MPKARDAAVSHNMLIYDLTVGYVVISLVFIGLLTVLVL